MNINIGNVENVVIPYHPGVRKWRNGWARHLRLFGLHLYFSNVKMRMRPKRDLLFTGYVVDHCKKNKQKLYERQGGRCPHCGGQFPYKEMELHHILPLARFPELGQSIRNGIMLCHKCHKEVHCNPWRNIQMMEEKAEELGIDLRERFDYGEDLQKAQG